MEFKTLLRRRRLELGVSQAAIAERLSQRGQETSDGRVGHWETGRNRPPLENPTFRHALAAALEMDVNEMMGQLGYIVTEEERSEHARLAAEIVDQLPPDRQKLAVEILRLLERGA